MTTDELRALVAKATPGPWTWHEDYNGRWSISAPHGGRTVVMDFSRQGMQGAQPRFAISGDDQPRGKRGGILCNVDDLPGGLRAHPDAALIVAAVNALPDLLDRLAAAERDAERMRDELRRVAVQGVTANPGVLHHYKCLACGGRWSGRPTVAEQHIGDCAAIDAARAKVKE